MGRVAPIPRGTHQSVKQKQSRTSARAAVMDTYPINKNVALFHLGSTSNGHPSASQSIMLQKCENSECDILVALASGREKNGNRDFGKSPEFRIGYDFMYV